MPPNIGKVEKFLCGLLGSVNIPEPHKSYWAKLLSRPVFWLTIFVLVLLSLFTVFPGLRPPFWPFMQSSTPTTATTTITTTINDVSNSSCSNIGNSGGTNITNCGQQDRVLTTNIEQQLLKLLDKKRIVEIWSVWGDAEALNYADKIKTYLVNNGYTIIDADSPFQADRNPPIPPGISFDPSAKSLDPAIPTMVQVIAVGAN